VRTFAFFALKLALAVVTVVYVAHTVAWGEIAAAAQTADAGWIVVALALLPANVGLEAYRWHRLVRRIAPEVRFGQTLAAVLSGYPLGLVTPGRLGDYAGRAFYLRHANKWELAALTFAERMATLACSLAFGFAALVPFLATRTDVPTLAWATVLYAGLFGTAFFVYLLLHPRTARRLLDLVLPGRFARRLAFLDAFDRGDAGSLLALSAVRYGIFSAQFVCLVFAFAPAAAWLPAVGGVVLVFFAKSAIPSFTLADLGIREGAAVYFMSALGIAGAAAFNAALALFCVNLLLPSLVGLPFVLKLRLAPEPVPAPVEVPS
jgi:uncharacterized membrane protein YbhN (UPF0104 family)